MTDDTTQADTGTAALIEIGAKALDENGEMQTLFDVYGDFEDNGRIPTIGWMIPASKEMQESIARTVIGSILPVIEAQHIAALAAKDAEVADLRALLAKVKSRLPSQLELEGHQGWCVPLQAIRYIARDFAEHDMSAVEQATGEGRGE